MSAAATDTDRWVGWYRQMWTIRLLIAEEQWHEGDWGATIISRLAQAGIAWKASPTAVSLPDDLLLPYSPTLEDELLPSTQRIAAAARTAVGR